MAQKPSGNPKTALAEAVTANGAMTFSFPHPQALFRCRRGNPPQVCLLPAIVYEAKNSLLLSHSQIGSFSLTPSPSPRGRGESIQCEHFVYSHTGGNQPAWRVGTQPQQNQFHGSQQVLPHLHPRIQGNTKQFLSCLLCIGDAFVPTVGSKAPCRTHDQQVPFCAIALNQ